MGSEASLLDDDELLHLANDALERDDPERAIGYLKRLLDRSPDDGPAWFLLGSVHAGIGMLERAIEELAQAVELEPELSIARFQLGLLLAAEGLVEEAATTWEPLAALGPDAPLHLFARGVEHFLHDRHAECVADLSRGIELDSEHASLHANIEGILADARETLAATTEAGAASDGPARRRLLAAYRRSDPDTVE